MNPSSRGRLRGIDHVVLGVPAGPESDRRRLTDAFYGDVLGLVRTVPSAVTPPTPPGGPVPLGGPGTPGPAAPGRAAPAGCWFTAPGLALHLQVQEPFIPARPAPVVLVVDDLDALAGRVADTGGAVEPMAPIEPAEPAEPVDDVESMEPAGPPPAAPGGTTAGTARWAQVDDPFGNRLQLVEMREPTPEMFQVLAERSIYPIHMLDDEGTIRWAGASHESFFGHRADDLAGRRFDQFVAPGSREATIEAFTNLDQVTEPTPWGGLAFPTELLHADGSTVACEAAALPTQRSGLPWHVVILRQAGYERALDHAVEAMAGGASLGELLSLVVTAVDEIMPQAVVAVGHRWDGDRFGVTAGAAAGMLGAHHPGAPWTRALTTDQPQYIDRKDLPGSLAALAVADGYESCWAHPVAVGADPLPSAAIVVWRTVAGWPTPFMRDNLRRAGQLLRLTLQWDRSHRALEFAATHDPLTGLVNRQTFHERLATVSRIGAGHAAVLYLDLDRFKPVNDRLGHQTGDRALGVVAERLVAALRPGDLVARLGGDEFAVLCERLPYAAAADQVAARLLDAVRQPILDLAVEQIHLDASIGVVEVRRGEPVDAVLARADEAMRDAKQDGRGRWLRRGD